MDFKETEYYCRKCNGKMMANPISSSSLSPSTSTPTLYRVLFCPYCAAHPEAYETLKNKLDLLKPKEGNGQM